MRELLLASVLLLMMMWDGWYVKQGISSRPAKDGSLEALHKWKERLIDDET